MQPLKKERNHAPLRTKNITQNHATSQETKMSRNLLGQKISRQITQPLGTK